MKRQMADEMPSNRTVILVMGVIIASIMLVFGSLYLARAANVDSWDRSMGDRGDATGHIYDTYPLTQCKEYFDMEMVTILKSEIAAFCDDDCVHVDGTRWSVIFTLNGVSLILLSFAFTLIAVGSRVFYARLLGVCLNCLTSCLHFAAIVVTAVYRFDNKGRLAMNCLDASTFEGEGEPLSDSWTFQKDGELITTLWACQLLVVFFICCIGLSPLRMKKISVQKRKTPVILDGNNKSEEEEDSGDREEEGQLKNSSRSS